MLSVSARCASAPDSYVRVAYLLWVVGTYIDRKEQEGGTRKYDKFVRAVLKEVHPDIKKINKKGRNLMNEFLNEVFEDVATSAFELAGFNDKDVLSSREIQTSVRIVFPGELAKGAVSEGTKAVTKFSSEP